MKQTILIVALLFAACAAPDATPPKIHSWTDCNDDTKVNAVNAFERCLSNVNMYAMTEYPPGDRFTPRDCERYAIDLYCVPSTTPKPDDSQLCKQLKQLTKCEGYDDFVNACFTRGG